ncbi:MAG: DUF2062 domain-containing protein [Marinosulfonomonas sp.]|nr:DUF2062 domain-containing protein [Marinosulfonomonas sp.]
MVFKRRDKRSFLRVLWELIYPKGGWTRAFHYVKHRVRRLPDPPHRIARGVFAGVLTSFTPFFGMHFVTAALISKAIQGNIIASIMATFFGNPITFPFIAVSSLKLGHWILGTTFDETSQHYLMGSFGGAWNDLKHNFKAIFTDATAHWDRLHSFYDEVFLPYLVGGLILGPIAGIICYYLSVPVISAYKNRRKGRLKAKLVEIREKKAAKKADDADK